MTSTETFRTLIDIKKSPRQLTHDDRIVMLGSCFTDSIGALMAREGFNVTVNPMGTLYNPLSIATAVSRAINQKAYTTDQLVEHQGAWHCMDFQSTVRGTDPVDVIERINAGLSALRDSLLSANTWIITFGTSRIYSLTGHGPVGNCHKLPGNLFEISMLNPDDICTLWEPLCNGRRVIFTVSPIRHVADGLHANQLSKARLLLAIEQIISQCPTAEYFPAYEIMMDDLRDYRFYSRDMKHPDDVAVDYIYSLFSDCYFDKTTKEKARLELNRWKHSQHRTLLT